MLGFPETGPKMKDVPEMRAAFELLMRAADEGLAIGENPWAVAHAMLFMVTKWLLLQMSAAALDERLLQRLVELQQEYTELLARLEGSQGATWNGG